MYDIVLNAAKFAFSEDARKGVSAIVELIQRSPEWQRDICLLEAKVESTHREHAALLAGLAEGKLKNLNYTAECINAFRIAFLEMTENAFQYGCGPGMAIAVAIEISSEYVSATVTNAKNFPFDFARDLQTRKECLTADPRSARGRGLLLIAKLSDGVEGILQRGVKAIFYRDRVLTETLRFDDLAIIRLDAGMLNPSLSRRIIAVVSPLLVSSDVVLDLSEYATVAGTVLITTAIHLQDLAGRMDRKFAVIEAQTIGKEVAFFEATGQAVFRTWEDTLRYLDRRFRSSELLLAVGERPRRLL